MDQNQYIARGIPERLFIFGQSVLMPAHMRKRKTFFHVCNCFISILVFGCEKFVVHAHSRLMITCIVLSLTESQQCAPVTCSVQFLIERNCFVPKSLQVVCLRQTVLHF